MHLIATFNHSLNLEIVLTRLEQQGIARKQILAVPLTRHSQAINLIDGIHNADGASRLGGALAFGTACMVLGTIYGFVWAGGPILWAIVSLFAGTGAWLGTERLLRQRKSASHNLETAPDVVLLINCDNHQYRVAYRLLVEHQAVAVGTYGLDSADNTSADVHQLE